MFKFRQEYVGRLGELATGLRFQSAIVETVFPRMWPFAYSHSFDFINMLYWLKVVLLWRKVTFAQKNTENQNIAK